MAKIQPIFLEVAKRDYEINGFALIPGVFDELECRAIRREALATAEKRPDKVQWLPSDAPALLFWPQESNKLLDDYAHDVRLYQIAAHFLGSDMRQINNQIYFRNPGDGDQFAWHQDILFRVPEPDFDNVHDHYLQTVILIDPMTPDSGAIEFLPGTQTLGDRKLLSSGTDPALRQFVRGESYGEKINASPGDVLVWHSLVIHGSEPNTAERARMTYMNGFAAERAVLNKEKYPRYVPT